MPHSDNVSIGQHVPDVTLIATSNITTTFSALRGKNIVLYFYPKDNTPGCTTEGQDFSTLHRKFIQYNTCVFGISRESLVSHEKFKAKYNFSFDLISDPEEILCKLFDVIKPKNMYGKQYLGIERSTFLIDKEGILQKEWRKVKVKEHADDVLSAAKELSES